MIFGQHSCHAVKVVFRDMHRTLTGWQRRAACRHVPAGAAAAVVSPKTWRLELVSSRAGGLALRFRMSVLSFVLKFYSPARAYRRTATFATARGSIVRNTRLVPVMARCLDCRNCGGAAKLISLLAKYVYFTGTFDLLAMCIFRFCTLTPLT